MFRRRDDRRRGLLTGLTLASVWILLQETPLVARAQDVEAPLPELPALVATALPTAGIGFPAADASRAEGELAYKLNRLALDQLTQDNEFLKRLSPDQGGVELHSFGQGYRELEHQLRGALESLTTGDAGAP